MEKPITVSLSNLDMVELTPDKIRTLKIITGSLMMGVLLFLLIILVIYYMHEPPERYETFNSTRLILFYLMLFFTPVAVVASNYFSNKQLEEFKTSISGSQEKDLNKLIQGITTYLIIKFAVLEAAALFGGVVLMNSIISDDIYYNQFLWFALLPFLIFFLLVGISFPTKEYINRIIREKIFV